MVGFFAILLQDFISIVEHDYFKGENLETQDSRGTTTNNLEMFCDT
jgi:hypothetical protein